MVPKIVFGTGKFNELDEIIKQIFDINSGYIVFLIDSVHQKTGIKNRLKFSQEDLVLDVDVSLHEPTTQQVDKISGQILSAKNNVLPALIVGIGGGSVMDIAKAVSVLLTNNGLSADYQGWDLPKERAILKLAIPTISGTGSEATRTAVLTSPTKKQGINSDQSIFDAAVLDPELIKTVDSPQEFFTGMDCYIHCVESLKGSFINEFGRSFAEPAKKNVEEFFLKEKNYEKLMMASFLGGCSVASSEVGICHALSYGVSLVFGYRHGLANCIVFNQLEEFYPEEVKIFKLMLEKNNIKLPENITKNATVEMFDKMINMTLVMEKPLTNALGQDWKNILTRDKIIELYKKM